MCVTANGGINPDLHKNHDGPRCAFCDPVPDKVKKAVGTVLAEYDRQVTANRIPDGWDTYAAVAADENGEVYWEVMQVADELGVVLPTDDRDMDAFLQQRITDYRGHLANLVLLERIAAAQATLTEAVATYDRRVNHRLTSGWRHNGELDHTATVLDDLARFLTDL